MNPNSLLVQWADGMEVVDDSAAITAAGGLVRRAFYSVADATTAQAARAMATQELARLQGGESIVAEPVVNVGNAAAPYAGWYVGDKIPVSGWDSGSDTVPVTGITVTEDENGDVRAVPELQSPLEVRAERNALKLRRAQPGLSSNTVSIARSADSQVRSGALQLEELSWGFEGQLLDKSPEMRFRRRCRITFWDMTLLVAGSTATALQILKNGTPITGRFSQNNVAAQDYALFPAGVNHVVVLIDEVVVTEMDTITFDITTVGSGAETMSCQLLGAVSEV